MRVCGYRAQSLARWVVCLVLLVPAILPAEPVAVRYAEGLAHGFLVLRGVEGKILASGDLIQSIRAGRVTSQVLFHFSDGSVHDETGVFSQSDHFQLLTYHLVQKGPAFPRPLDMTINTQTGRVVVRYNDDDGKEKVEDEKLDLPADVANAMVIVLLKNLTSKTVPATASYVAATPRPRLVKLNISAAGAEPFSTAGADRRATHYVVKAEIGGVAGLLAPLVGKQPPDTHVWILEGPAPAFVKSEGPLYVGGPLWRIELISPVWPGAKR
jgi:hypothetical protein